ncbi:molybdopterin cofactor-binding domain-containing protein [Colwellia sp. E2M01]|uniref:xanthine dehydrogenase family protein molybdopterin-binding subunit n=1 Tax=Colwellia sp. E2M01 TaxID=2841561 RepID=UPI001C08FC2B|nr:molybdopterin cofactor-binding domain-containing protein [Colwellia sp. E2M01]MBU2869720.1 molybdopterin-dependent oxidoreductase [Colwellia sp. E2M01]
MNPLKLSRRDFLTYAGISSSGLLLGCSSIISNSSKVKILPPENNATQQLNIFVAIKPDNSIEIVSHRSEMGQGSKTGIPQIVADELECSWDNVHVIQGKGNKEYGDQNTDGSSSIRKFYDKLREMGASARTMLEQAAADYWKISIDDVYAKDNKVFNKITGNSVSYGDLAELASKQPVPDIKTLNYKSADNFKYIGKSVPIVDLDDILTGKTVYGIDVDLPDMLIASIERCPVLHGQVKSFDATEALKVPGVVEVIQMPPTPETVVYSPLAGVAVLATNTWAAQEGRKALLVEWDLGKNKEHDSTIAFTTFKDNLANKPQRVAGRGDVVKGFSEASKVIEAQYQLPYLAHAPMEPPMATAWFHDGICDVWACVQDPQSVMANAASMTKLPVDIFNVQPTLLGGAFGRKSKTDFANEAVYLANITKKPVKVVWSREDDVRSGYYHAGAVQTLKAGLNNKNEITTWAQKAAYPTIASTFNSKKNTPQDFELSLGFGDLPYDIDNILMEKAEAETPVRIGWMRSVCNIQHAFALNCFVDEVAHAANVPTDQMILKTLGKDRDLDPKEAFDFNFTNYDEKLERHPYSVARYRGVLEALLAKTPIDETLPKGQGWGIAVHRSFVSYVAVATKVEVINQRLTVKEIHTAIDCGLAINPDRIKSQMEGAMIFGMSIALMGKINIKKGAVVQSNFHDYPVTRMNQTPVIVVHLVNPKNNAPGGVGEPGVPPVAPSIVNAVFAATGERYRELPLNQYLTI